MNALLMLLGGVTSYIGKIGLFISVIAWVLGLLSVIPYVSFWWISGFFTLFIGGIFVAAMGTLSKTKRRF